MKIKFHRGMAVAGHPEGKTSVESGDVVDWPDSAAAQTFVNDGDAEIVPDEPSEKKKTTEAESETNSKGANANHHSQKAPPKHKKR